MFLFAILEGFGLSKLVSRLVVWGVIAVAAVLAVWASIHAFENWKEGLREEGRAEVIAEWKFANAQAALAAERLGRDAFIHMERTSADFESKKAKKRATTRTIIERIPVYVPVPDATPIGDLSHDRAVESLTGLVLLHDAAIAGVDPGPEAVGELVQAARAVVPSHFARVLVENLGECGERELQVNGLIDAYEGLVRNIERYNADIMQIRKGAGE